MRKSPAKIGLGQLTLTFGPPKDETRETQDNGPVASGGPAALGIGPERKRKWNSLIDKVYALPNLQRAWEHVAANKGAPGIDGMTISRFAENAPERLRSLHEDLRNKTYKPQPVRRVYIQKDSGGRRPLGIPNVRDRIVQQALRQVLEPIFDAKFSDHSHGFRKERGCATALKIVDQAVKHGFTWVVDADIAAFFDTVDHEKLLSALNDEIADGSVLKLIRHILTAGVVEPLAVDSDPTQLGTPQGGPLSPLLANVYLHAFDVVMEAAGLGLVRYADDFVVFTKSKERADTALALIREVLEGALGLRLHSEKTRVVSVDEGFEFLGFHYFRDPKTGKLRKEVRQKSAQRFREAIRRKTPRLKTQRRVKPRHITFNRLRENRRIAEMIGSLNRYLQGWHWYFKPVWSAYPDTPFRNFDGFVRMRLRTAITGRVGNYGWWQTRLKTELLRSLGLTYLDDYQRAYLKDRLAAPVRKDRTDGEPYAGHLHVRFGREGGG